MAAGLHSVHYPSLRVQWDPQNCNHNCRLVLSWIQTPSVARLLIHGTMCLPWQSWSFILLSPFANTQSKQRRVQLSREKTPLSTIVFLQMNKSSFVFVHKNRECTTCSCGVFCEVSSASVRMFEHKIDAATSGRRNNLEHQNSCPSVCAKFVPKHAKQRKEISIRLMFNWLWNRWSMKRNIH